MKTLFLKQLSLQKTILVTLFTVSIFGLGCKKDSPAPFQSYLRFKVDGTQIECNENIRAHFSGVASLMEALNINGRYGNISIEMQLYENIDISNGQYVFDAYHYRRATVWIDDHSYYTGDEGIYNLLAGSGEITITEISQQFVKGTFRLTTGVSAYTNQFKNITDGEFYIKVQ